MWEPGDHMHCDLRRFGGKIWTHGILVGINRSEEIRTEYVVSCRGDEYPLWGKELGKAELQPVRSVA